MALEYTYRTRTGGEPIARIVKLGSFLQPEDKEVARRAAKEFLENEKPMGGDFSDMELVWREPLEAG